MERKFIISNFKSKITKDGGLNRIKYLNKIIKERKNSLIVSEFDLNRIKVIIETKKMIICQQ